MDPSPAWLEPAEISAVVARLAVEANTQLGPDVVAAFQEALQRERSPAGRNVLGQLLENASLASATAVPYCQDTGMVVVFARLGNRVLLTSGTLQEAIDQGVRTAYTEHPLRKSVVADPFGRANTRDNTPAIVHLEHVPGDALELDVMPKGFGGENMSLLRMLPPSAGWEGIEACVVETVVAAGPNSCPPLVVGVGIGGDFELAPLLAKKALLRRVGAPHPNPEIAAREARLQAAVNATGVGPQGLGGLTTAVAVHLEVYATHIAALPVAVNLGCNAFRHRSTVLHGHPQGTASLAPRHDGLAGDPEYRPPNRPSGDEGRPTTAESTPVVGPSALGASVPGASSLVAHGHDPTAALDAALPAAQELTPEAAPQATRVTLPLDGDVARTLRVGQPVLLNGPIYGFRDAAHARLHALIQDGRESELPIDLRGAGVYYVGPAPARVGQVVGSAGPTTSERMDAYTPALVERGLRLMLGKGRRGAAVKESMRRHGAVYLVATGGAAALLARHIVASEVVAYPELGTEAIHLMTLRDFPCLVAIDVHGHDVYETGPRAYAAPRRAGQSRFG